MNSRNLFVVVLITGFFVISACKKPTDSDSSKVASVVTVVSPAEGAVFSTTDSILFSGNASDNEDLHTGRISITRNSDGYLLVAKTLYVHSIKSYDYNEKLQVTVTQATPVKAVIQFEDHDGNVTNKEVNITLNP